MIETPSTSSVQEATISQEHNPEMEQVIERNTIVRDHMAHRQLQSDLIEHIWITLLENKTLVPGRNPRLISVPSPVPSDRY